MKLVYLIGSLGGGGAEKVMSALINHLNDIHQQKLITYSSEKVHDVNAPHRVMGYKSTNSRIRNFMSKVSIFRDVYREKKMYDVCVSFMEVPNIMNVLTPTRCKALISVRSLTSENIKSAKGLQYTVLNLMLKWTYPRADKVVAVSREVKADLVEKFNVDANKIEIVHNPLNFDLIEQLKHEALTEDEKRMFDKKTIIHCGRLTEAKGHWYLLKIFKRVKEAGLDVNLVLLGEGELRSETENLIDALGLKDSVFLMGYKKNPYKYLKHSDVFLYTSLWEGFPNAVLDAMACSNAVVSSDCQSGIHEILTTSDVSFDSLGIVEGEYGILTPRFAREMDFSIEIGETEDLVAKTVVGLLSNQKKLNAYKIGAFNRAQDFHIDKIMNQWNAVIERQ